MEPVLSCFRVLEVITVIYMQHFISLPDKTQREATIRP